MKKRFLIFIMLLTSLFCQGAKNSQKIISEIDDEVRKIDYEYKLEKKFEKIESEQYYLGYYPITFYYDKNGNVRKIENKISEFNVFYIKNGKIIHVVRIINPAVLPTGEANVLSYYLNSSGKVIRVVSRLFHSLEYMESFEGYSSLPENPKHEWVMDIENLNEEAKKKINDEVPKPIKFQKKIRKN